MNLKKWLGNKTFLSFGIIIYFVFAALYSLSINIHSPFWLRENKFTQFMALEFVLAPFPIIFVIPTLNTKLIRICYNLNGPQGKQSRCDNQNYFLSDYENYLNLKKLAFALNPFQWFLEELIKNNDSPEKLEEIWLKFKGNKQIEKYIPEEIKSNRSGRQIRFSRYMLNSFYSYYCKSNESASYKLDVYIDLLNTTHNKIYNFQFSDTRKCSKS